MSLKKRLIAPITLKGDLVIQSYCFNRYLPVGKLNFALENLCRWSVDEIFINVIDNSIKNIGPSKKVIDTVSNLKIDTPLIYCGGIRSHEDAQITLESGFERIGVCNSLIQNFIEVKHISKMIGSQALIAVIPFMYDKKNFYFYDYLNKKKINLNNLAHIFDNTVISEILLIDVMAEGSKSKFCKKILNHHLISNFKIICYGGFQNNINFKQYLDNKYISAIAVENYFNFGEHYYQLLKKNINNIVRSEKYEKKRNHFM